MNERGTNNKHEISILKVQETFDEYSLYEASEDEMMFEMANLLPKRTGLKYQIWYSAKVPGHKPIIKVDLNDGCCLSIQIETHEVKGAVDKILSKDLKKIFSWIDLNKGVLLRYWDEAYEGKIDTAEMDKLLKPVGPDITNKKDF